MFFVDVRLDSGTHLQSLTVDEWPEAQAIGEDLCNQTMVEEVAVIHDQTAEVFWIRRSRVALGRNAQEARRG
jgi:hypothetical protein